MADAEAHDPRDEVRRRVVEIVGRLLAETWIRDQSVDKPKKQPFEVGHPDRSAAR